MTLDGLSFWTAGRSRCCCSSWSRWSWSTNWATSSWPGWPASASWSSGSASRRGPGCSVTTTRPNTRSTTCRSAASSGSRARRPNSDDPRAFTNASLPEAADRPRRRRHDEPADGRVPAVHRRLGLQPGRSSRSSAAGRDQTRRRQPAGLQAGDTLISIDGQTPFVCSSSSTDPIAALAAAICWLTPARRCTLVVADAAGAQRLGHGQPASTRRRQNLGARAWSWAAIAGQHARAIPVQRGRPGRRRHRRAMGLILGAARRHRQAASCPTHPGAARRSGPGRHRLGHRPRRRAAQRADAAAADRRPSSRPTWPWSTSCRSRRSTAARS